MVIPTYCPVPASGREHAVGEGEHVVERQLAVEAALVGLVQRGAACPRDVRRDCGAEELPHVIGEVKH